MPDKKSVTRFTSYFSLTMLSIMVVTLTAGCARTVDKSLLKDGFKNTSIGNQYFEKASTKRAQVIFEYSPGNGNIKIVDINNKAFTEKYLEDIYTANVKSMDSSGITLYNKDVDRYDY